MSLPRLFKPFKPFHHGYLHERISEWFESELGQRIIGAERRVVNQILPSMFGYYLLQTGAGKPVHLIDDCTIKQQFFISDVVTKTAATLGECRMRVICSRLSDLALASDSVDVGLIHHTLDFDSNPHKTLREITRTILPGGKLVIIGFNPWSLWGMMRLVMRQSAHPPWSGNFISPYRLSDWLNLLDFQIEGCETLEFGLPSVRTRWLSAFAWLEVAGRRWWQQSGAVYVLVATKRLATVTPIKPRRLPAANLITLPVRGIARTTSRPESSQRNCPEEKS
jgi:SAM-dependent methyltransferase